MINIVVVIVVSFVSSSGLSFQRYNYGPSFPPPFPLFFCFPPMAGLFHRLPTPPPDPTPSLSFELTSAPASYTSYFS